VPKVANDTRPHPVPCPASHLPGAWRHTGPVQAAGAPAPRMRDQAANIPSRAGRRTHGSSSTRQATWTGSLAEGSGMINYVTSGSFTRLPVSWPRG